MPDIRRLYEGTVAINECCHEFSQMLFSNPSDGASWTLLHGLVSREDPTRLDVIRRETHRCLGGVFKRAATPMQVFTHVSPPPRTHTECCEIQSFQQFLIHGQSAPRRGFSCQLRFPKHARMGTTFKQQITFALISYHLTKHIDRRFHYSNAGSSLPPMICQRYHVVFASSTSVHPLVPKYVV
jgi:hypothetical protein